MNKYVYWVLCALVVVGLTSITIYQSSSSEWILQKGDTVILPVSSLGDFKANQLQYFQQNGKSYLAALFKEKHRIMAWSWPEGKPFFSLNLRQLAFDTYWSGMNIRNTDSILLCGHYTNLLLVIDTSLAIKDYWLMDGPTDTAPDSGWYVYSHLRNPITWYPPLIWAGHIVKVKSIAAYADTRPQMIIDMAQKRILCTYGRYPEAYQDETYHLTGIQQSALVHQNGSSILSYPVDHKLYRYNYKQPIDTVNVPSKYLLQYNFPAFDNSTNTFEYANSLGHYNRLLYNPYKKIYYRIAIHPQDKKNIEGGVLRMDAPWSILVLDSSLNILTEKYMPAKTYRYSNVFVCPQGLAVSLNHPKVMKEEGDKRDALKFKIFSLTNQNSTL